MHPNRLLAGVDLAVYSTGGKAVPVDERSPDSALLPKLWLR